MENRNKSRLREFAEDLILVFMPKDPEGIREMSNSELFGIYFAIALILLLTGIGSMIR